MQAIFSAKSEKTHKENLGNFYCSITAWIKGCGKQIQVHGNLQGEQKRTHTLVQNTTWSGVLCKDSRYNVRALSRSRQK